MSEAVGSFLPQEEWRFDQITEEEELRVCREYEFARESRILRATIASVRADRKSLGEAFAAHPPHRMDIPIEVYEQAVRLGAFAPARVSRFPETPYLALDAEEKKELRKGTHLEGGTPFARNPFLETNYQFVRKDRPAIFRTNGLYVGELLFNLEYANPRIIEEVTAFLDDLRSRLPAKLAERPLIQRPFQLANRKGKDKTISIVTDLRRLSIARMLTFYQTLPGLRRALEAQHLENLFSDQFLDDNEWYKASGELQSAVVGLFSIRGAENDVPLCIRNRRENQPG